MTSGVLFCCLYHPPTSNLLSFAIIYFATGPVDTEGEGRPICVVSIVRSGDILQEAVSFPHVADPVFFYR
jgi:hypothetical protein